jgi:hypothetical protein
MGSRPVRMAPGMILAALGAMGVALLLTVPTALPGIAFWDTGELQAVGPLLGTAHPTGFPTWVILGWLGSVALGPFGEPAFRMNLLNALCVAVGSGLTAILVRGLTGRTWLAFASGILLASTPIVWAIGTHADAHGLHLALVALILVVLVDWERLERAGRPGADRRLIAAAIAYGLALGNHSLVLLLAPGIAGFMLAVAPGILRRRRLVATCLVACLAALAVVYLELPLRAGPLRAPLVYGHPETWDGFWYVALAQQFQGSLIAPFSDLGGKAAALVGFAVGQLGVLVWLVPFGFVATALRRPRYALLSGTTLIVTCWFAASYNNAQIERYYLIPALIVVTWIAVLGAALSDALDVLVSAGKSRERPAAPVVGLLVAGLILAPSIALLPAHRALVDQSGDRAAANWLDAILDERVAGRDAVIVSWWSYSTPLWYAQHVEGRRPDIRIVDDRTRLDEHLGDIPAVIDANLGRRPVLVVQFDPTILAALAGRYELTSLPVPGPQAVYRVDAVLADATR